MRFAGLSLVLSMPVLGAVGFNITRRDNVAMYWGQNCYGATHLDESSKWQKSLSYYCKDNSTDIIPMAFLNKFSTGGLPEINLGNICSEGSNGTFPGTSLVNCTGIAREIKACQAKGKLVTLSLGGSVGSVSFSGDDQAQAFADTIWNLFLGGSSKTRPFGSAVLDGLDLDVESGTPTGYETFVNRIRSHASGTKKKKYYITAAPQCVYPDGTLGGVLNTTWLDAVFVQFYNNPCGLQNYNSSYWNFGIWDHWARNVSPNKNVKVYIGAPGANDTASIGYVPISKLKSVAVKMRKSYPSFGGVVLWDASSAYVNGRYELGIKNALRAAGGAGFKYPGCSAPAYTPGQAYTGGERVSHDGYMWQAKWWTDEVPIHDPLCEWNAVSACQGTPPPGKDPASAPSSVESVVPGIPTGALAGGEQGMCEQAYLWRVGLGLASLVAVFLSW